jgi:hypothetical protein
MRMVICEGGMKSWTKRYLLSCVVALFAFASFNGYRRPGQDPRFGSAVVMAAAWPVVLTFACGSALGEMVRGHG